MPPALTPPDHCPVCGESVPGTAKACPGCGADERTGWNEEATRYDGLDLPGDDRDPLPKKSGRESVVFWVTIILLGVVVLLFVFRH